MLATMGSTPGYTGGDQHSSSVCLQSFSYGDSPPDYHCFAEEASPGIYRPNSRENLDPHRDMGMEERGVGATGFVNGKFNQNGDDNGTGHYPHILAPGHDHNHHVGMSVFNQFINKLVLMCFNLREKRNKTLIPVAIASIVDHHSVYLPKTYTSIKCINNFVYLIS